MSSDHHPMTRADVVQFDRDLRLTSGEATESIVSWALSQSCDDTVVNWFASASVGYPHQGILL
jgi:hypothetical protein